VKSYHEKYGQLVDLPVVAPLLLTLLVGRGLGSVQTIVVLTQVGGVVALKTELLLTK
jgi:hypothetical protein